nr:reverse transcriptase domain-containing protein [Tanacetum cinerariifolium]
DSRRKRRKRVSSSSSDSSDNEDEETGHCKSRNGYRNQEDEDMSRPWRRQKVDAFTRRISDFSEDKRRRMPANVKTYDGTGDPDDHLKIFESAATIKNWPQPVWCHMFSSTLVGNARNWFSKLPCRSIDGFEELRRAFLLNFTQRKKRAKNPVELARVKQRQGESTSAYTQKEILATKGANFPKPPPMRTPEERCVGNGYCEYHGQKGHTTNECVQLRQLIDKLVKEGRLDHLVKNIKEGKDKQKSGGKKDTPKDKADTIYMVQSWQRKTRQNASQKFSRESEITFLTLTADNTVVEPLTIEINAGVKSQLNPATTSLTGFTGEKIWPIEKIRLLVIVGNEEHSTRTWMTFMVIRSPSPYNGIIGRPGISAIRAVPSTAHGMLKFHVDNGIVTIYNTTVPPRECNTVEWGSLSDRGRAAMCALLQRNIDIFAWEPKHMTGVPCSIIVNKLKIRQGYFPVRQKKQLNAITRSNT